MQPARVWLPEPRLAGVEVNSREYFEIQKSIIAERPLVRRNYELWYRLMLGDIATVPAAQSGEVLEIGAGSGYVKTVDPRVITSDLEAGNVDMIVDARSLPFGDASLRGILLTHVFHHIPDVRAFLREAVRTLVPGGVIAMIDVAHTPLARFLFGNFDSEAYDSSSREWTLDVEHLLGAANQALTWIVFCRDRAAFDAEFPELQVECIERLPWLAYLCSGGVTRRNLVPKPVAAAIAGLDAMSPLAGSLCALHWHIRIRKKR